jgi:hypothetical protein
VIESGVYVTFFDDGEPFDRELPPIGPLVSVVARGAQLVAERKTIEHSMMGDAVRSWIEAELEYQRATGQTSDGVRRKVMRVTAPAGIYLRFATFGEPGEFMPQPELGPFATIVVGERSVDADGAVLATRATPSDAWELTAAAGTNAAGLRKSDIGFRAIGGTYHPNISTAAPRAREWPSAPTALSSLSR